MAQARSGPDHLATSCSSKPPARDRCARSKPSRHCPQAGAGRNAEPGEDQPLLPELPVKVEVKSFALAELKLAEPILGTAVGSRPPARQSSATLRKGSIFGWASTAWISQVPLTTRLGLVPEGQRLNLTQRSMNRPGDFWRRPDIPGLPPVKLDLSGQGTLDAFQARLPSRPAQQSGPAATQALLGWTSAAAWARPRRPRIGASAKRRGSRLCWHDQTAGTVAFSDDGSVTIPGTTRSHCSQARRYGVD